MVNNTYFVWSKSTVKSVGLQKLGPHLLYSCTAGAELKDETWLIIGRLLYSIYYRFYLTDLYNSLLYFEYPKPSHELVLGLIFTVPNFFLSTSTMMIMILEDRIYHTLY